MGGGVARDCDEFVESHPLRAVDGVTRDCWRWIPTSEVVNGLIEAVF